MKILYVVTGLQKASGVTVFVEELARELRALGHEVMFVTRNDGSDVSKLPYDVVHVHGLWDPWLHKWSCAAQKVGIPVVWSPHGMLQKWALKNKWWKKFLGLALYQYWSLRKADLIHVTAQSEVGDVRRLGLKNEVVIAPLGVRVNEFNCHRALTRKPSAISLRSITTYTSEQKHTLLFVSRVQRKKGLPNLLEAWAKMPEELTKAWTIRIVGPDQDNHTAELMAQCERLGLTYVDQGGKFHCTPSTYTSTRPEVEFVGPKYDSELDAEYSNADLFVLPTHSENFGSVVIEALAHGVPVITTKEAPWAELEEFKCGWWVDDNVEALTMALQEALSLHCTSTPITYPSLARMGENGRALVEERYTWSAVCDKMVRGYEEVLNGRA